MAGGRDDLLWDDAAFKRRIGAACKKRGLAIADVLTAAGVSKFYLKKPVEGRSTNVVAKIARELGISPAELAFGVTALRDERNKLVHAFESAAHPGLDLSGHLDEESLRRLIATMFTAQQVMALLYLALNQKEGGLPAVTDLVLKAAHGGVWAWPVNNHPPRTTRRPLRSVPTWAWA